MKIIGVTGGVGAGKSVILSYLEEQYDAKVVLADVVANRLKEPGAPCYQPILDLLGTDILAADGTIDRKAMGKKIFADAGLLSQVNGIIHPAVKAYIIEEIEIHKKKHTKLFVIEAALLLEDHYDAICDEVWYIDTSEEVRRQRLKESRGYSDEYITDIIQKQLSEEEFREKCDVVIDNSGSLTFTRSQIDKRMLEHEIM